MKEIVSGAMGFRDYHLIFINVIIGKLLVFLYSITNQISWYEVFQFFCIYISLVQISFVIFNKTKNNSLFIVFLLIVSIYLYSQLQFTKTSSILSIAGGLLLIYYLLDRKENKYLIKSFILLLLGYLMRGAQFFAISGIMFFGFIPFFSKRLPYKGSIIMIIILLVSIFSCKLYDNYSYNNKDRQYFNYYNSLRSELMDDGWPDYDSNLSVYESIDINKNAFNLLSNWEFNDSKKFTTKEMELLISAKEKKVVNNSVFSSLKMMYHFFTDDNILITSLLFLVFFFICFISPNYRVKNILSVFLMIFCFFIETYACCLINNVLKTRVIYSLMIAITIIMFYLFDLDFLNRKNGNFVYLLFGFCLTVFLFKSNIQLLNRKSSNKELIKAIDNVMCKDYTIVTSIESNIFYVDDLFVINDFGYYKKKVDLGGWGTKSPINLRAEKNNDITNPYSDLVKKDDIVLITSESVYNKIIQYIKDYYSNDAIGIKMMKIYNNVNMYKIVEINND